MSDETETTPETPAGGEVKNWWNEGEFTDEQLTTAKRYKDRGSFHKAFFEQRKALSNHIEPPDASKLKPEEYAVKIKEYRAKGGGVTDPKGFKASWPSDVAGYVEGHAPELMNEILADAAEWGLTQAEVDAKIKRLGDAFREQMQAQQEAATNTEREQNEAIAKADKALQDLWGDAKETNVNNATLFARRMDAELFAKDNEGLSEAERADRGGLLAQDLRNLPPEARSRMTRLFNNLWGRLYAESTPVDTGTRQGNNLHADRYARAKAQWPNRGPEWWDAAARSTMDL